MPKAYQKLIVILFILSCFTAFSQTEKIQQEKNNEYGNALKKWFDNGDLIVELSIQETDVVFVKTNGDYGYMCAKAKITRVLKGNIEKGFININTNSPQKREVEIVDEGVDVSKVIGTRCVVKIKKSNLPQGFKTESTSVYVTEDKVYRLEEVGFDMHYKMVDGKKTTYNSTEAFYKILYSCCEINSGNK